MGSLFGLNPYSSTSFLLASSASLRCFRFLQKNRRARTIRATAAIGTTTATAILPLGDNPLFAGELLLGEGSAVAPDVVDEDDDRVDVVAGTGKLVVVGCSVLVNVITTGDPLSPVEDAVWVNSDVTTVGVSVVNVEAGIIIVLEVGMAMVVGIEDGLLDGVKVEKAVVV